MSFRLKTLLTCSIIVVFLSVAVITAPADAEAWGNGKIPPGLQKKFDNKQGKFDNFFWFNPELEKHLPYGQLKKTERFREMFRCTLNPGFVYLDGTVIEVLPGDPAFIIIDVDEDDMPLAVIRVADDATIMVDGKEANLREVEGYSAIVLVNPGGNAIVISADSDGNYREDDRDAPEVVMLEPADGENDVETGLKKLTVTFDENIYRVYSESYIEDRIEVKNVTESDKIDVSDIDINSRELVINLDRGLEEECKYSVYIPEGLFKDSDGNEFDGIDRGDWVFTTKEESDEETPEIVKLEPADDAEDVEIGLKELTATFDEKIYRVYSEDYIESRIKVENVTKNRTVGVADIDINDRELVIHLNRALEEDCEYSVYIPEGLFRDSDDNRFAGIDRGEWEFTTDEEKDDEDPEINSLEPANGEKVYNNIKEIVARFDEKIEWANSDEGQGRVFVFNLSENKMLEPREALIVDDRLVIRFNDYLDEGEYGVTILSGAIEDLAGNEFDGISISEWSFEIM